MTNNKKTGSQAFAPFSKADSSSLVRGGITPLCTLMPGAIGRRSLFEECSPKFLEQIENALPTRAAAARAGLHIDTVMDWLAKGRKEKTGKFSEFLERYTRAVGNRGKLTH